MEAKPLTLNAGATILFEGDSLTRFPGRPNFETWPWMRLSNAHYGYPEKVGDWIFCHRPDLEITCRLGAVGGAVMGDVLERFSSVTEALKPDVVVMTIGTNDANREVPLKDFRAQAEEYCRRLRDLCGGRWFIWGMQRLRGMRVPRRWRVRRDTGRTAGRWRRWWRLLGGWLWTWVRC